MLESNQSLPIMSLEHENPIWGILDPNGSPVAFTKLPVIRVYHGIERLETLQELFNVLDRPLPRRHFWHVDWTLDLINEGLKARIRVVKGKGKTPPDMCRIIRQLQTGEVEMSFVRRWDGQLIADAAFDMYSSFALLCISTSMLNRQFSAVLLGGVEPDGECVLRLSTF